ncbi:hypothetical protein IVA95_29785 [Bradyrhizobium sp. 157]|uniref:hypothetical protein n=1 Tax=Bradyrhizobium sp. 157 TaxID=2782631 RepID=UPI001FF7B947|nr:hypothetical protein [Bradyrhizobium sp. 157]MCK1641622.1 hypothetical protein [Bradyrhizobium sp. 157]
MSRKDVLLEQIARAKRFVAAMNTEADREKFEGLAASYQSEFDTLEAAEGQSSPVAAAPTSQTASLRNEPVAAMDQTGTSERSWTPTSASDQAPTTD